MELIQNISELSLEQLKKLIPSPQNFISIEQVLSAPQGVLLIDVRSEGEFSDYRIPGSINIPILNNEERATVGTLYKRVNQRDAYLEAFRIARPKNDQIIETIKKHLTGGTFSEIWVTCWRGGLRSSYVVNLLSKAFEPRIRVAQVKGGTKAFRRRVFEDLQSENFYPQVLVLSGNTGSGKSRLLEYLHREGYPVVHIEQCAHHMSSVFGEIPYRTKKEKITQKQFEILLHQAVLESKKRMHESRLPHAFIEAESRRVGHLLLPEILDQKIHSSPTVRLETDIELRCKIISEDYLDDPASCIPLLKEKLALIHRRLGPELYQQLNTSLSQGATQDFFATILTKYYDRVYKTYPVVPLKTLFPRTLDELFSQGRELVTV